MKLIEIKSKNTYSYCGDVYDFEVEDEHSYNVNGIIVHNSDYVMLGSVFNKALESCANNYLFGIKLNKNYAELLYNNGMPIKKYYRGMSTKAAQKAMGKTDFKTSEGITRFRRVEYTLYGWIDNLKHYLRTAMSYSDAKTLQEFIGNVEITLITKNAYDRYNK